MTRSFILGVLFVVIIATIVAMVAMMRRRTTTSPGTTPDLATGIQGIIPGTSSAEVERRLGAPPNRSGTDWVYYLDAHSGYRIEFDPSGVVARVRSWES